MRKFFTKLAGVVLACVMVFGMSVPAYALPGLSMEEEEWEGFDVNIGMDQPTPPADITMQGRGSKFVAYRLLDLTTSLKMDHEDHPGAEHTKDCYNYAYKLNDTYTEILREALGLGETAGRAEIVGAIGALDEEATREFADKVFDKVKGMTPDETATAKVFARVDQGYYLIAETDTEDEFDALSLVMLDTAGQDNITVTVKDDVPTVTKKIKEKDDAKGTTSDWQDAADYDSGDMVPFQLTGTLPVNFKQFDKYQYVFHDKLSVGLTFVDNDLVVKVVHANGEADTLEAGDYTVRAGGSDMCADCSFDVVIADARALLGGSLEATDKIVVEYTALLDGSAVAGTAGNTNEVYLEFSNNPYNGGEGTSKTPKDKVIGFTYTLIVDKIDGNENPLAGAGFRLYKWFAGPDGSEGAWVALRDQSAQAEQTTFTFDGLDAGKYKLEEVKVPAGYNKVDDIEFEVVAVYAPTVDADGENTPEVPELTGLRVVSSDGETILSEGEDANFQVTLEPGEIATKVINETGVHLPTTGGDGTKLLYVGGAIAIVVGGAIVVAVNNKKRKAAGAHVEK